MNAGDTIRFREGRNGTFNPATQLVVKEVVGDWFIADFERREWFLRADRVEVVEECPEQPTS